MLVVPGAVDLDEPVPAAVVGALRAAGGTLVSICAGAFVLAAAGVDHRRRARTGGAAMKTRSFSRHFRRQTGATPGRL